jgi:hypothetical protein
MDDPQGFSAQYNAIDYFELPANNAHSFTVWDEFYRLIYRSNLVIERVPAINFPTQFQTNSAGTSFKNQFIGEAQFLRAFAYFNLVRLYGGVPLRTTEIKSAAEVNIPKASEADVYAQIEKDLTGAIANLPGTYSNSGVGNERGRATKWSALAMLADMYLTQKKYTEAKNTALQVIQNNNGLRLLNNYKDNFPALNGGNENTAESLFEIQFSATDVAANRVAQWGNNFSYIMGPFPDPVTAGQNLTRYRPTNNASLIPNEPGFSGGLIQEYETGDLRLTDNFWERTQGTGISIYLTKKYYEPGRGAAGFGNFPVYRMAEMYLIYAEATNELGAPDAQAIDYINQLRRRAFGLPLNTVSVRDIPAGQTQVSFRNIVRSERRKELAMENKRWFDLVRYGFQYAQDVLVTKQKRTNFTQTKLLFPIAQVEIINNPLLTQNPGY